MLEPAGRFSLEIRFASDDLIQDHTDGPEIRGDVDITGVQPLRRGILRAAELIGREFPGERKALAMPKSSTLTWPSGVMRMLRGLISPWTIP